MSVPDGEVIQRTPPHGSNRRSAPAGGLLVGAIFFGAAHYWPEFVGGPLNAADQLNLGFFKFMGAMAAIGGAAGYYGAWRQRVKRKAAELPSGTFGEAAFASLEDCEETGLLNPRGLYLGLLDGQPLFYSGKAHLLTCAPARQGKGINVVIPNLLHFQGSVIVTDPKGELAAVTARHRAERFGQKVVIINPWGLHGLPQHRINPLEGLIALAADPQRQRGLMDELKAHALQLHPEPEDMRNRYFREGTRGILRAPPLYLAVQNRSVARCRRCGGSSPTRAASNGPSKPCAARTRSAVCWPIGDDLAHQLEDNPEHFGDFRAGAVQALDIYAPGGYLADALGGSDVSLDELKSGKVSIYLASRRTGSPPTGPRSG